MEISIEKRMMHTYVANVMEMFNFIKEKIECQKNKLDNTQKLKLFGVFVRVLQIIAPSMSKTIQN